MQKRASPRDLSQMSRTLRDARRGTTLFFIFALTCLEALAQQGMPAGMRGWWYYDPNSPEKSGFAQTAAEGCRLNAANHFGQPLRAMLPSDSRKPSFDCYYAHTVGGEVHSYTATRLYCNEGYSEKWPGICVKFNETAHPPSCTPDQAAFAVGNPVVLYSGTKVQTETDLEGTPSGTLQVERIYRSVRESGKGQSGGPAWSFSFDRSLNLTLTSTGTPPSTVTGTFADGSYFEFQRQSSGTYVSAFDKRETLKSQSPTHDLWAITRSNGDVEIFKNLNKQYLLVSLHSKTGTGEFYSYSNDNKLEAISDSAGRRLAITWDDDAIAAISGATGTVRYRYDFDDVRNDSSYPGRRRLASVEFYDVTDRYLASRKYHYESPGYPYLLTGITDEKGVRFSTYTYNESGLAIVSEHAGGANRYKYQYLDGNTRIVTDPLGTERTIGLSYSSVSRISRVLNLSQPAGVGCDPGTTAFTYDSAGRKTSSTDFNDNKTCFVTDPVRGLVTTEVSGLTRSSTCPSSATSAIPANSRRISKLWHPDVPLEIAIASPGLVTRFFYNGQIGDNGDIESCAEGGALPNEKPLHVLCAKSEQPTSDLNGATGFSAVPLGSPRTWRYSYNATGQIIGISSPPSGLETPKWTQFFYYADTTDKHSKGDLAKILNSSGEVAEFLEYTNNGQVRKFKGNDGLVIQLEYGPRQRILSTTLETHNGDREPTQHFYDQVGQRIRTILPDGSAIAFQYDDAHRLTDVIDPTGNHLKLRLDSMGNVTRREIRNTQDDLVLENNRSFDALNRVVTTQNVPYPEETKFQYDRNGNRIIVADALGRLSTSYFDRFDRRVMETFTAATPGSLEAVVGFSYDHQDRLISVTDPKKLTITYSLDGFGRRLVLSSPDTGTTQYIYDQSGNLLSSRDARGFVAEYRYDSSGRLSSIGESTFRYGANGTSAAGRLAEMIDESGKTSFSYDNFGRTQQKTQVIRNGSESTTFVASYEYGKVGNTIGHLTAVTYPSGSRIEIGYGNDGRANRISLRDSSTAASTQIISDITYTAFGPVAGWRWGGVESEGANVYRREYDSQGRITSYTLGPLSNGGSIRKLNYDAGSRIKSITHGLSPTAARLEQNFDYDNLGRLVSVDGLNMSQAFDYDINGNRMRAQFGAASYRYSVEPHSNRVTAISGSASTKRNSYDAQGNVTYDGTTAFAYDSNSRLVTAERDGVTTRYRYNGFGQRVEKADSLGARTFYVYDTDGRLIGEYDGSGKPIQETVYLNDIPMAVLKPHVAEPGGQVTMAPYGIYADHILTPRIIMRLDDNRIVWRWDHADPFGLVQPDESPFGLPYFIYNPRFPGQLYDKETGYHYNYFRDYDPATGRYVQSDPIGLEGGINTYGYVGSNPLTFFDRDGLIKVSFFGAENDPYMEMLTYFYDDIPGECLVFGHGNQASMLDGRKKKSVHMNSKQLAAALFKAGCKKEMRVTLFSCNTGRGENSIGEKLAKNFSEVNAPTRYLWYEESTYLPRLIFGKDGKYIDRSDRGTMRSFR